MTNQLSSVERKRSEANDAQARLVRSPYEHRLRRSPYRYRSDRGWGLVKRQHFIPAPYIRIRPVRITFREPRFHSLPTGDDHDVVEVADVLT